MSSRPTVLVLEIKEGAKNQVKTTIHSLFPCKRNRFVGSLIHHSNPTHMLRDGFADATLAVLLDPVGVRLDGGPARVDC